MAHIYHHQVVDIEDKHAHIRAIDEEDYHVAITFSDADSEDNVSEILLTRSEVQTAYDLLFNR